MTCLQGKPTESQSDYEETHQHHLHFGNSNRNCSAAVFFPHWEGYNQTKQKITRVVGWRSEDTEFLLCWGSYREVRQTRRQPGHPSRSSSWNCHITHNPAHNGRESKGSDRHWHTCVHCSQQLMVWTTQLSIHRWTGTRLLPLIHWLLLIFRLLLICLCLSM